MNSRANENVWDDFRRALEHSARRPLLNIVILAAHPDDESIGASVLLTRSNATVVYLTDGAPRDTGLWPPNMQCSREEYAATRRLEAERAVTCAGVSPEQIVWLGAADQEGTFEVAKNTSALVELLEQRRPDVLVTHPYEGGHPDHDACALLARLTTEMVAADVRPELAEMTSYHAREGACVTGEFLNSDPSSELIVALSEAQRYVKHKMMMAHASQRRVLQYFDTKHERYRKAPRYDFTKPPHNGKLWYECMNWQMTSKRWCAIAREAMSEAKVLACR